MAALVMPACPKALHRRSALKFLGAHMSKRTPCCCSTCRGFNAFSEDSSEGGAGRQACPLPV